MIEKRKYRRAMRVVNAEDPWNAYITATMAREPSDRPWVTAHEMDAEKRALMKERLRALDAMAKTAIS